MRRVLSWANRVTLSRIALVFFLAVLVYDKNMLARLLAAFLAVLIIIGDWLDGYLARKLHEASALGGVLDIAGDRILESVMWIILADLRLVPVWIPITILSRTILTDTIRGYLLRYDYTAFGKTTMMRSAVGRFLTGSPVMRTSYAILKAFTFGWLLLISALQEIWKHAPPVPELWLTKGLVIGYWAAVLTAIICLARGIPPIIEGTMLIREMEGKGQ